MVSQRALGIERVKRKGDLKEFVKLKWQKYRLKTLKFEPLDSEEQKKLLEKLCAHPVYRQGKRPFAKIGGNEYWEAWESKD